MSGAVKESHEPRLLTDVLAADADSQTGATGTDCLCPTYSVEVRRARRAGGATHTIRLVSRVTIPAKR